MPTATCVKGLPPSPVDVMRDVKTDQSPVFLQKRENARAEAKAPSRRDCQRTQPEGVLLDLLRGSGRSMGLLGLDYQSQQEERFPRSFQGTLSRYFTYQTPTNFSSSLLHLDIQLYFICGN